MAKKKTAEAQQPQAEGAEQGETKLNVTIEDAGPCKKKISVEIPAEKVKESFQAKYQELRKESVLPGFRKGRAPMRLLEKRFGLDIGKQVKLELIVDAADKALKENKLEYLGDPDIDHEKIEVSESAPLKFDFQIEVRPEFELPELEGIEIEKPVIEVNDARIDEEVVNFCKRAGVWSPKDGAVEIEDQVIADVLIQVEGAGEPEKHDNIEIFSRKTGFVSVIPVEDLDQILAGAKAGDTKTASVHVPATFYNEQYRDKKIEVEMVIKEVKSLKPAELTDEFLKRFGYDNVDQIRDYYRNQLTNLSERQSRSAMSDQVHHYLQDKIEFDLPADVVAGQSLSIMQRQYANMLMRGMQKEQIEQQMEQLRSSSEEQAKDQLKLLFIMDKIAEKFDIHVTDEEINGYIAQAAAYRQRRPEKVREEMLRDGSLAQFTLQIREEKCVEKILEKAKISDVAPEKATKPKKRVIRTKAKKSEVQED